MITTTMGLEETSVSGDTEQSDTTVTYMVDWVHGDTPSLWP